jgi:arsenate reductase
MAEGFCRHLWPNDISAHQSKALDELDSLVFDCVVTVCGHANENCRVFPGTSSVVHRGFDAPQKLRVVFF